MQSETESPLASLARLYRLFVLVLSTPVLLADYFRPETGAAYGVGFTDKVVLAGKMLRNNRRIPTGSTFLEHLVVATKAFRVPPAVDGCLVECGCYKGGSTANLSLVASLCDRKLAVFDSFDGMPDPSAADAEHVLVASEQVHTYEEDSWRGSLGEVEQNVAQYGDRSVCEFRVGYFEDSMPAFEEPCAVVFLDVGLRESAETCLEQLWPLLADGGYLFTHDVKHMEISTLFFDADWWRDHLDREPPGLVGAGNGLGLHPDSDGFSSLLGYIVKNPELASFREVAETGDGETRVDATVTGSE